MIDLNDAPPGYTSVVHTGPMIPVTIWKAPGEYVLPNMLVAMLIVLMLTVRWAAIAVLWHLILIAFWAYDRYLLPDLLESIKTRHFLGVE